MANIITQLKHVLDTERAAAERLATIFQQGNSVRNVDTGETFSDDASVSCYAYLRNDATSLMVDWLNPDSSLRLELASQWELVETVAA